MIRLEEHKDLTEDKLIQRAKLPQKVFVPLLQHFGKSLDILKVRTGDRVKKGQCLATSETGIFAPVHASISGVVTSIGEYTHPLIGSCRAVTIEGDGKDEGISSIFLRSGEETDALSADELRQMVFDAGVVGLGGAGFPSHIKLKPPKPINDFILNGLECEPYLTADYRLMIERSDELIKGIKLVSKMAGFHNCYIAIEDNKPQAIEAMRQLARMFNWEVVVLKTGYPQGSEKQVIRSCLKKEVPSGKLPFDIGVLVHNVGTVYAIYEAVYLRKPLYERVVTVSGTCLSKPANLIARIGTPVGDLVKECGPLTKEPKKMIMGGPMMGIAQFAIDVPVIKSTSGIILLDEAEEKKEEESFCIRCGECVNNCPLGLNPGMIVLAIAKDKLDLAQQYGVLDCIECGLCAYLCPGRRNIVQAIKTAKMRIRSAKK